MRPSSMPTLLAWLLISPALLPQSGPKQSDFALERAADAAILDGLCWLARHQNSDGSWSADKLQERCAKSSRCFDESLHRTEHYAEGVTGLALLCFLRAGYTPDSKEELPDTHAGTRHSVQQVMSRALEWLLARQNKDGSFTPERPFMYNEAMAALPLAEVFDRTRNQKWRVPAQRSIDLLQDAQRRNPTGKGLWGWRYESRRVLEQRIGDGDKAAGKNAGELHGADISVTAWCTAALRAGQDAGLKVKADALTGALDFCSSCTVADGRVGYLDADSAGAFVEGPFDKEFDYHPAVMSAAGICIRSLASRRPDATVLEKSADRILEDPPTIGKKPDSIDYYYWYYGTSALSHVDGPRSAKKSGRYWKPWMRVVVDSLLSLQDRTEKACRHGGWLTCDRWSLYSGEGPLAATTLSLLTLEAAVGSK